LFPAARGAIWEPRDTTLTKSPGFWPGGLDLKKQVAG
jgi:hypothetical protein